MTARKNHISIVWIALWVASMVAGVLVLDTYSSQSGMAGESPAEWPADCGMERSTDGSTLLMFVHPRCPCSRASIRELARIHARTTNRVDIRVVFFEPATAMDDWSMTCFGFLVQSES